MSKNKVIDYASATFSEPLMSLITKNFANVEARSNGILEALKKAIVTISEDIDVHEDSLSQVGVSLGSPGSIGLPSV